MRKLIAPILVGLAFAGVLGCEAKDTDTPAPNGSNLDSLSGVVLAHNHVLNPSGQCNESPWGADGPGNTSGLTNPANSPQGDMKIGKAKAFARGNAERATDNC